MLNGFAYLFYFTLFSKLVIKNFLSGFEPLDLPLIRPVFFVLKDFSNLFYFTLFSIVIMKKSFLRTWTVDLPLSKPLTLALDQLILSWTALVIYLRYYFLQGHDEKHFGRDLNHLFATYKTLVLTTWPVDFNSITFFSKVVM